MHMVSSRFIDFGDTDPLGSQAVYHGLARAMGPDDDPILDMVRPDGQYVCIGAHQELEKEVDVEYAEAKGLPIYRRHVGGGTVLLDDGQYFWHFIIPTDKVESTPGALFERFSQPVIDTYRHFGLEAAYNPVNDIVAGGKKIGGTGAGDIGEATVIVGSFMLDFDIEQMVKVIQAPSEKFQDKMFKTMQENMTTMRAELGELPPLDELKAVFRESVEDRLGWELRDDSPTDVELEAIEAARDELADPDWVRRKGLHGPEDRTKVREGVHVSEGRHKATGGLIRATVVEADGVIDDLVLSGDIQILPETGLDDLAADLVGEPLDDGELTDAAAASLDRRGIETPGVTPADFSTAIRAAVAEA